MKLSSMILVAAVSSLSSSLIVFLPSSSIIGVNADQDDQLLFDCPLDCGMNGYCELVYNDDGDDDDDDFSGSGSGNVNDDNNDVDVAVAVASERQSSIMPAVTVPGGNMQAYNEDDYFRCDCDYGYSGSSCEIIDLDYFRDDDEGTGIDLNDDDDDVDDDDDDFYTTSTTTYYVNDGGFFNSGAAFAAAAASAVPSSSSSSSGYDDDNNNGEFLFPGDGCPFDCQNDGQCISIFGGLAYACLCVEPYWGSQCEQIEPCDLDCSDIDTTGSNSGSKDGAFCVDSPEDLVTNNNADDDDDFNSKFGLPPVHTCVHCEEILEEPACDRTCLNGGICENKYLFTGANGENEDEDEPTITSTTTAVGPSFQCSTTVSMVIATNNGNNDGMTQQQQQQLQIEWQDLTPFTSYCVCPVGYQGKDCEEIDVCGGCQNNGYCISNETPENDGDDGDDIFSGLLNFDDNFNSNFDDDDFNFDDDFFNINYDDNLNNTFDGDDVFGICNCISGGCDQTGCESGAGCLGGRCKQDGLTNPSCTGGKCSQQDTTDASCVGGNCDQTGSNGATCIGQNCFFENNDDDGTFSDVLCPSQPAKNFCDCSNDCQDNPDWCSCEAAQNCCNGVSSSQSQTAPPTEPEPYCSCEYGYFGNICEQTMTTICIPGFQVIHDYCMKVGGFCPLDMDLVGERFCANGGACGDDYGYGDITSSLTKDGSSLFRCDCPDGFEGINCELQYTEAPVPTTSSAPSSSPAKNTSIATDESSSGAVTSLHVAKMVMGSWHFFAFAIPFAIFCYY